MSGERAVAARSWSGYLRTMPMASPTALPRRAAANVTGGMHHRGRTTPGVRPGSGGSWSSSEPRWRRTPSTSIQAVCSLRSLAHSRRCSADPLEGPPARQNRARWGHNRESASPLTSVQAQRCNRLPETTLQPDRDVPVNTERSPSMVGRAEFTGRRGRCAAHTRPAPSTAERGHGRRRGLLRGVSR